MTAGNRPLALVTGGARGYGVYVVRELAAQGHRVAVLGRDASAVGEIAEEVGGVALTADVEDVAQVRDAVARLTTEHGAVEVLVNNAGVGGTLGPAWEVDGDAWWRTFEVNVRGTYNVTSALVPVMRDAGRGRIINVASNAGVARWPLGSAYAVSKAAVIKFGENLAAEVRRYGIVVLNFHPGTLEIGLTQTLLESEPEPGTYERMVADWFREQIATGRTVAPERSAKQLALLASGIADELTGRYFTAYDEIESIVARAPEIIAANHYTLGLLRD